MRISLFLLCTGLLPIAGRAQTALTPRDSAFHVLNRLAYGPEPGQADSVARTGVMRWVDRQLDAGPADTDELRERERGFVILERSPADLAQVYLQVRRERAAAKGDSSAGRAALTDAQRLARKLQGEMAQLTVVRAVAANEQLREVMTDFWVNHFNVFANKGADRYLLPSYIETTIRPRALGRFEDLLLATAHSPAMLFYLDNAQSVAPDTGRRNSGINENYARELMELHTLGVDGGQTQQDIINVARIFTGWGIDRPSRGGFVFNERAHDRGSKIVLGTAFPAGHGEDEGVRLLKLLARNPATMRHVASKFCARLVSDIHSGGCEDAAVAAWKRTDGDMREVVRAIIRSPDFWAPQSVRAKVKTPLEFVVSAVRALAGVADTTRGLAQAVARLGEPLYQQSSPAGYAERQDEWVNSGALLNRMNVAVALAAGRLRGVSIDPDAVVPANLDHDRMIATIDRQMLAGAMTAHTREVIVREIADIADPSAARAFAIGLTLGSPEFQRQ